MKTILIAAELWDVFAEANSCQQAAEQKANRPVSVHTFDYGGFLHTVFSTIWGPYGEARKSIIDAYQLWPSALYSGETTLVYHDEEAIASGQRQRGDSTGLIVSVKGRLMVCAEKQRFLKGLPGTRPLSPAEADAFEEKSRQSGWRALWYPGKLPEWRSLSGHPVALYRDHATTGEDRAILLWEDRDGIREMGIAGDVVLESAVSDRHFRRQAPQLSQMELF